MGLFICLSKNGIPFSGHAISGAWPKSCCHNYGKASWEQNVSFLMCRCHVFVDLPHTYYLSGSSSSYSYNDKTVL